MNKKMIIAGSIVAVGVVGIGGAVLAKDTIMAQVFPGAYIAQATQNTNKQLEKEAEQSGVFGDFPDFSKEEAVESNLQLYIDKVDGQKVKDIAPEFAQFNLNINNQKNETETLTGISLNQDKTLLVGADLYQSDEEVALKISPFLNEFIKFNVKTFATDFNQSELRTLLELPEIPADFEVPTATTETFELEGLQGMMDEMNAIAKENMVIEYVGKENVEGQKCRVFEMVIEEDAVEDIMDVYVDFIMNDLGIETVIKKSIEMEYGTYYTQEEMNTMVDEMMLEVETVFDTIQYKEGMVCNLAINSKEQIVRSGGTLELEVEGETAQVDVEMLLTGAKVLSDDVKVTIKVKTEYETIKMEVTSQSNLGEKTPEKIRDIEFKAKDEYGTAFEVSLNTSANVDTDALSGKLAIKVGEDTTVALDYKGSAVIDAKAKSATIDIKQLEVSMKDYYEEVSVAFAGKYDVKAVDPKTLAPTYAKDLFTMSEDDFYKMLMGVVLNADKFTSQMEELGLYY